MEAVASIDFGNLLNSMNDSPKANLAECDSEANKSPKSITQVSLNQTQSSKNENQNQNQNQNQNENENQTRKEIQKGEANEEEEQKNIVNIEKLLLKPNDPISKNNTLNKVEQRNKSICRIKDVTPDDQELLLYLVRHAVENAHPRPSTNSIKLFKQEEVVLIHVSETVPEAFDKLITGNFLSAPVVSGGGKYVGFIDMLDLVNHTVGSFTAWQGRNKRLSDRDQIIPSTDDWRAFWKLNDFRNAHVAEIIQHPSWPSHDAFHPVFRGFSLLYAIEMMVRCKVHRVPVIDKYNHVVGIITESMIISLLDQVIDKFSTLKMSKIKDILPLLPHSRMKKIITIPQSFAAIDAFKMMLANDISGLGVTNEEGVLVDVISVRDLRGIGSRANDFSMLWYTVGMFKNECRNLYPSQTPDKPIYVTENATYERVLTKMEDGNIHRVFVCKMNDNNLPIPINVLTQRDVLSFLVYKLGLTPPF